MPRRWEVSTIDKALPGTRGCVDFITPRYVKLVGGISIPPRYTKGRKCSQVILLARKEMTQAKKHLGEHSAILAKGHGRLFWLKKPMLKVIDWFIWK